MALDFGSIGSGAAAGSAFGPWGAVVGGVLGAAAGGQGSEGQSLQRRVGPETELERQARQAQLGGFQRLEDIQRGSLGQNAGQSANALADLLRQYQQSGGIPGQADLTAGQQFAQASTAPQQQQIELAMRQAQQQSAQLAGLSGRRPNDFALQTRLGQQRTDAMAALGAQQSALGAQYAQQFSQNRLGFAEQLNSLNQGLATQALQNRMAIMGLGSQIQGREQNFRLGTAEQYTPGKSGTMLGTLTGALQGAGMGVSLMNAFGGGGSTSPSNNGFSASSLNFGPGLQAPSFGSTQQTPVSYLGKISPSPVSSGSNMSRFTTPTSVPSMAPSYSTSLPSPGYFDLGNSINQANNVIVNPQLPFYQRNF